MKAHEFLSKDACPVCGQTPCNCTHINEDLRKWFKEKWVRFGPDGKIRGDCARGSEGEGKPKCLPQSKAHALGKKGRATAASRKRREDPNPERSGKAINVKTKESQLDELKCWPGHHRVPGTKAGTPGSCAKNESVEEAQQCPECGGPMFSELMINEKQDACYYKVKSRYKVWPSAYASGALVQCRKKGAKNWGNKSKNEGRDMKINQVVAEAANPAQQAAIAIAMKKAHKKPKTEGVAEGYDNADDYQAKAQWLRRNLHVSPDEAWEMAYSTDLDTWVGSPWEDDYKSNVAGNIESFSSDELFNKVRSASRKAIKQTGDQSISSITVAVRSVLPSSSVTKKITSPRSLEALDNALRDEGIDFDELLTFLDKKAQYWGKKGVAENHNPEYDDEAGMADNNLETLKRAVQGIDNVIQPGDNLPEWCQEKIAVAKSMLVAVWDYMKSEEERQLAEEFDMIERIVESIADYNGVDADVVWTDLESLTEDELYAFAVTSQLNEDWQKANKKDRTDGMSRKAVKAYRREHPGSKLQTAVTTKPSKLKKGSKASKRRKSYCSRSRGQMKMHNISCAKTPDKAICKARRRWNC